MSVASESMIEKQLIDQLVAMKYEQVSIQNEAALLENFKHQLETFNEDTYSQSEFEKILTHLKPGTIFDKAKKLRDRFTFKRDGENVYVDFLDTKHWCKNLYQVTHQVTIEGKHTNRYDVTLLINGLPLVQIELKRSGIEIKEAFNQVGRYQSDSFGANSALFQYAQIFVISNHANTKYYANNKAFNFEYTFYWTDVDNTKIASLNAFTEHFLEPSHIHKMIGHYIILHEGMQTLMVLRPYQYYAVEAIVKRVKESDKNGYIWHTTGSGKTATSFKAAQVLIDLKDEDENPLIDKVVFVVDRKDLDYQTAKEFNHFSENSVDNTTNTKTLVDQFLGTHLKGGIVFESNLIVTTIQKLNNAIESDRFKTQMMGQQDKRIVFIFDECHRSQFGITHANIKNFFTNAQMIGFTGTPIFVDNALSNAKGKQTTADLFHDQLHRYVITDAIRDHNVLPFSVEYVGRYKEKESANEIDIEVEDIDTKELLESDAHVENIVEYILQHHDQKTHNRDFTAMMCVSSVDMLTKYYEAFKRAKTHGYGAQEDDQMIEGALVFLTKSPGIRRKTHDLKIATIFSYSANEDLQEGDETAVDEAHIDMRSREKLDGYIQDYNDMFGTQFSTKDSKTFYRYYNDLAQRVKNKEIDILLVVNMFLTGFDAPKLNTLYVDKNLRFHGLIQAFSRTNRLVSSKKSHGNIVCFRNLKEATDDAIGLFSNKDAKETENILLEPYSEYVRRFNEKLKDLFKIASDPEDVDQIIGEKDLAEFVICFRALLRLLNILEGFSDFSWDDLGIDEEQFMKFRSKYVDEADKVRRENQGEAKASILNDVDFELELIRRDRINLDYILQLLAKYKQADEEEQKKQRNQFSNLIDSDPKLRSKKALIEKFINENLAGIDNTDQIKAAFDQFMEEQKTQALDTLCHDEALIKDEVVKIIQNYQYTKRKPLKTDMKALMQKQLPIRERKTVLPKLLDKLMEFIERFYDE